MRDNLHYEASRIEPDYPGEGLTVASVAVACCLAVVAALLYWLV